MPDVEHGIPLGSRWRTGAWREEPRYLTVTGSNVVASHKESILTDNDIEFRFDDGQASACGYGIFKRLYVRAPA